MGSTLYHRLRHGLRVAFRLGAPGARSATRAWAVLCCLALWARSSPAQGHGPIYGLSTPTLGKGGWSVDLALMQRLAGSRAAVMVRPMLSYGVTEDLQASVSLPVPAYVPQRLPQSRATSRMPMSPDVEMLLGWRFHRRGTGVGRRIESTAWLGLDYPTDAVRAGAQTAPGVYGALVTGYASRTLYAWAGGLYRRYLGLVGDSTDQLGDVAMYSVVVGYRPAAFRRDYPHPDWRIFLEAVGEVAGRTAIRGIPQVATGGHRIFLAPTLLGLYGSWGISGGLAFPLWQKLHGNQTKDRGRAVVNITFWL